MKKTLSAAAIAGALVLPVLFGGGCEPAGPPPNIVLVVLDTLRRDATGDAGDRYGRQNLTPAFDRIAAEGTHFTNAWSNAPWTVPSHASLFTGLLPSEHGCTHRHRRLDLGLPTLAEMMRSAGYNTLAVFSNPWLTDKATGLLRGFSFRAVSPIGGFDDLKSPLGDHGGRQSLEHVARFLSQRTPEDPFFLFVNFLEPHLPYDPPPEYRREHLADIPAEEKVSIGWAHRFNAGLVDPSGVDWNRVGRLYGGDASTVDAYLDRLVDLLKEGGIYENTVLIVTSDHGENLGEHGLVEHQFSVHETLLAVPLVIRAPRRLLEPGRREEPVMLTDLFATILDLGGALPEDIPAYSRTLLRKEQAQTRERPVLAEYAPEPSDMIKVLLGLNPDLERERLMSGWRTVRVGRWRLTEGSQDEVFLHDMERDPLQGENLAEENPDRVAELRRLLPAPAPALPERGEEPPEMDEETREQLRSLGYIK